MYELIDKIENNEICFIMTLFYIDLRLGKIFKDYIDFKDTPLKDYDYDLAIKSFEKVVKYIIKNQKSSWHH